MRRRRAGNRHNPRVATPRSTELATAEHEERPPHFPSRGLKATRVDGVYDADPEKYPEAQLYSRIGYTELLSNRLQALDATAVSLAMDNDMPIVVFDMTVPGNIARAVRGERIEPLIAGEES